MTKPPANKPAFRLWFSIYAFTAFIMTIAVMVFAWLASESRKEAGEGRTAKSQPVRSGPIPAERLQLLAQFDAPPYAVDPSAKEPVLFVQAMQKYSAGDYPRAIAGLRAVATAQPNFAPAHFYLGICLVLSHDRPAGLQELNAATRAKGSPYVEQARFYLAKTLLGQGDRSGAQQQLDRVIAMQGSLEPQARILLGQIQ
ncbi:MAG TPA: hypothetical protein VF146_14050 [Bryobacteraceae bacterium]